MCVIKKFKSFFEVEGASGISEIKQSIVEKNKGMSSFSASLYQGLYSETLLLSNSSINSLYFDFNLHNGLCSTSQVRKYFTGF